MNLDVQVLVYALLAASSPVVLLATLVVLSTERGRVNGIVFGAAFVLGQAAGLGIPLMIGVAVTSRTSENGTMTASRSWPRRRLWCPARAGSRRSTWARRMS
jgi:hypothetical protein